MSSEISPDNVSKIIGRSLGREKGFQPTIQDLGGLPETFFQEGKSITSLSIQWLSKLSGISEKDIAADSPKTESLYASIRKAFEKATYYLSESLNYKDSEIDTTPLGQDISSLKDFVKFVEKTNLAPPSGLSLGSIYCRLFKVAFIAYEVERTQGESSHDDSETIELKLFRNPAFAGAVFRGKGFDSQITKYLVRDGSTIEYAQKDYLGCMLGCKEDDLMKRVPGIIAAIKAMGGKKITVADERFFKTNAGSRSFSENLVLLFGERVKQITSVTHESGSQNYRSLKIIASIEVPNIFNGPTRRQIEIQIIPVGHQNDTIDTDHRVYEVVKKVTARTRLDGRCPASVFEDFCQEAQTKDFSALEIKQSLLKRGVIELIEAGKSCRAVQIEKFHKTHNL